MLMILGRSTWVKRLILLIFISNEATNLLSGKLRIFNIACTLTAEAPENIKTAVSEKARIIVRRVAGYTLPQKTC